MTDYIIGGEILTKRKLVTIDGSMVTTETGIPLALNIVLPNVKAAGADVRLAKFDGTPIAREIECIDVPSTDAVMLHYLFNTTTGENGQFYVYWGNASLTEPAIDSTYGSQAVWDNNYEIVYHMLESSSTILDSTTNGNNGTKVGSVLSNGEYGKSQYFDSINDYISIPDTIGGEASFTIEHYIKPSSITGDTQYFAHRHTSIYDQMYLQASTGIFIYDFDSVTTRTSFATTNTAVAGNYYYTAMAWEPSEKMRIYVDNVGEDDDADTGGTPNAQTTYIGRSGYSMVGYYDEVRYSKIRRSNNWLETTSKNLNNPTTSGTDPFYLSRYDDSQTYSTKSDSDGTESTFLRRTPITRNHTGALTDYQQSYTIPYHVLMNTDFSDFRFNTQADGNGDYLPYWIESQTDSDTADVWIKSDYASGDDIIYMFYGNSSLTSESFITDTMDVGDDFLGSSLDSGIWDNQYCTVGVSGGILSLSSFLSTGGRFGGGVLGKRLISTPFICECRKKSVYASDGSYSGMSNYHNVRNDDSASSNLVYDNDIDGYNLNEGSISGVISGFTWSADTYYRLKITHEGSQIRYYSDGSEYSGSPSSSNIPNEQMYMVIGGDADHSPTINVDWIFVRKYAAAEPTYTIGVTTAPNKFSAVSDSDGNVSIFERRKPVKLTHSGILTDYQYYETFDYESAMLDNFDDIRFVTQSGEHIPYWIETKTDGVSAKVWFMNDYVDGDTYIWMYYGSEGLSSGSSGDDTFDFFDDFTEDLSKWTETDSGTNVGIVSGELRTLGNEVWGTNGVLSTTTFTKPFILEFLKTENSAVASYTYWGLNSGIAVPTNSGLLIEPYTTTSEYRRWRDGEILDVEDWVVNQSYHLKFVIKDTGYILYREGSTLETDTTWSQGTNTKISISQYGSAGYGYTDNVFVRKYTVVEPTITVGAEQHSRTGNIIIL